MLELHLGYSVHAVLNIGICIYDVFSLHFAFQGDRQRNVVMWMDHRAEEQAARITNAGHRVLSRVGGVMSPEIQPPKLLWLKEVRGEQGQHRTTDLYALLSLSVLAGQHVPSVVLEVFQPYRHFSWEASDRLNLQNMVKFPCKWFVGQGLVVHACAIISLSDHFPLVFSSESKRKLLEQSCSLF